LEETKEYRGGYRRYVKRYRTVCTEQRKSVRELGEMSVGKSGEGHRYEVHEGWGLRKFEFAGSEMGIRNGACNVVTI
jgi:hypothetical protein